MSLDDLFVTALATVLTLLPFPGTERRFVYLARWRDLWGFFQRKERWKGFGRHSACVILERVEAGTGELKLVMLWSARVSGGLLEDSL